MGKEGADDTDGKIVTDGKQKISTNSESARGYLVGIYGETTKFVMHAGVSLINNSNAAVGVHGSTFEMKGGVISNNRNIMDGGGVDVSGGMFIME